ncbi:MAG: hypothetical protein L0G39_20955 [Chryseobacterium sp.]|nr:hypothetical protein [Chryseobacterium sp.]
MAVSYIPQDKVFAVCTYQLNSEPRKFSFSRKTADVYYQNSKQPLLTVDDKNIMVEFTCKSPWNLAGTLLAFGAGLIVGALLLSNPIGWVILGAGIVVAGAIVALKAVSHKCTDPLNGGQWFLAHNSVKINGASAITRTSILKCKKDGILTPFFDEASAKAAASSIATKNKWELGINVVASFGAGFFLPSAFAGFGTASIGMKAWMTVGRFGMGFLAFSSLNYGLRGGIRWWHENIDDLRDNVTYENMNNHKENIVDTKTGKSEETDIDENNYWGVPAKPDDFTQDSEDLLKVEKSGGKYNITVLSKVTNIVTSYSIHTKNKDLMLQLDKLDGLSRPVLRNNPLAKQLLNDLNSGKYPEWKNSVRFYNNRRMTPSMVDDGRTVVAENLKSSLGNLKSNSIQGGLFLIPFIGTIFSEEARAALAGGMANDMAAEPNGSSVIANNPVD